MPTAPFYVTATPPGQLTTLGTSEKLLVTAVSTDTLTIVRAQSPTTAKSIDANWVVANAMYVDDVMKSNIATDEALSGTKNGTNTVFTTASAFTAIQVYKNGVAMHIGDDFTVTGANQITMVTAPASGTQLTATYIIGSQVMIAGSSSLATDETPTGSVNGSNTSFTTTKPYVANTLQVYVNGIKQKRGTHFSEITPTSGTFTISDAPLTGDDVMVEYQFVQSVAGNADTVDGYHASTTPGASQLLALNSRSQSGEWWEELARQTLSSGASSLSLSSLPQKKYLKLIATIIPTGGTFDPKLRFNNDAAANYSMAILYNNAGVANYSNQTATTFIQASSTVYAGGIAVIEATILNVASFNKLVVGTMSQDGSTFTSAQSPLLEYSMVNGLLVQ